MAVNGFGNGEPNRPHFGLDIAAPVGTPVVAPVDGVVTWHIRICFTLAGPFIIDHGMVFSTFIHLNKVPVKKGINFSEARRLRWSAPRDAPPGLIWTGV